jgi:GYF domain 2
MADQWYYASDEQKLGPYSAVQLKQLAALTKLRPSDTVWKNDIEKGVLAAKVRHLFADLPVIAIPVEAIPAEAIELIVSAQPPEVLAAIITTAVAHLEPLPTLANGHKASAEHLLKIPDVIVLQVLPSKFDSSPLPTPWTNFPSPEGMQAAGPETPPASKAGADSIESRSPANQNPNQPTPSKTAKKGRATAVRGAVIVYQDGENVKYRKKCIKCSNEDSCTRAMPIKNGITRVSYYCPKCRKNGEVLIQGQVF